MSEALENVYGLLDDEDKEEKTEETETENEEVKAEGVEKKSEKNDQKEVVSAAVEEIQKDDNGDSSWTDVSSTKTRKTAIPVASLFHKQDIATPARGSSAAAVTPAVTVSLATFAAQSAEAPKKKVLRFTREELLALYRPTKCPPEICGLAEISTLEPLEPECRNVFDHEEVLKLWHAADAAKQKEAGGRGRGRGKRDEDGHYSSHQRDDDNNQDMWDDIDAASSKTFDLADFSAAAFKFSESSTKLTEATSLYSKEGDETMESLLNEEIEKKQPEEPKFGNEKGRNLLLQTLSVKPAETKPAAPKTPFKATVVASTDDTLLDELIDEDVVIAPLETEGSEKNDDSLTFDAADDLDIDSIIGGLTATPLLMETKPIPQPVPQPHVLPSAAPSIPASFLHQQPMQQHLQPQSQPQQQPMYSLGSQQMPRPQMSSPSRPLPQSHLLPMMSQPAPVVLPDKWIYRDPHGNIQGPFEMSAMRRWLESGYFKENLPIKMTRWNTFYPLGVVYPNPETAFLSLIIEPMQQQQQQPPHMAPQHMMPPPPQQQQQQHVMTQSQQSLQHQSTAMQQMQEQRPQRSEATTRQIEESSGHSQHEEDSMKGKRAVAKQNAPEPDTPASAPVASKQAKKSKDSQQKDEPTKAKTAAVTTPPAASSSSDSAPKQKDQQKKTKTAKKSSKDEDSQSNKNADNAAADASASGATPWANKKAREGNDSKTLTLTEIQKQEEAAKKQHNSEHQTENAPTSARSFQLKNLLGVGGKEKGWSASSNASPQSAASLREIQVEQERISQEVATQQQQHRAAVAAASGPPASATAQVQLNLSQSQWKSPQQNQGAARLALAEIMEQERLAAAAASASQQNEVKPKGGSWAAKAGGSKAMDSGIPAAWIAGQSQKPQDSGNSDPTPASAVAGKSAKRVAAPAPQPTQAAQQTAKKTPSAAALPSNGDSIVDWSVQQLKRFTSDDKSSTDDLALIEFCLTLKSAVEIREYLADYLGSTPQVSQFATEFIRRKEGKQPTQLRSTAGGTALTSASLQFEKDKGKATNTMPTETMKKKKQRGKGGGAEA